LYCQQITIVSASSFSNDALCLPQNGIRHWEEEEEEDKRRVLNRFIVKEILSKEMNAEARK